VTGAPPAGVSDPADPLAAVRLAAAVARDHAPAVDREAVFPSASVATLRRYRLMAAAVPRRFGGLELDLATMTAAARILGGACGATAMIWSMHQVQVACIARHAGGNDTLVRLLRSGVADQFLVASATSERGVGGDLRTSHAHVERRAGECHLDKHATVVSYGGQADAFLVTARRGAGSPPGDQVAVLVRRADAELEQAGAAWNPMGMRGTCSPGYRIRARFGAGQVLPTPFGDVAAATMVPLSHLLWAGVWTGLATEAFDRARRFVRERTLVGGLSSGEHRLATADQLLIGLEARLADAVQRYRLVYDGGGAPTSGLGVCLNALKVAASTVSVDIAELALEICGMAGYQEDGPYTVARILRDLYSARLMIANDRLLDANALNLLLTRRD
jgi:acyl-CoA dehydrogenase